DLSDLRIRIRGFNTAVKIERAIRLWLAERKNKRKRKWYLEDLEMASAGGKEQEDREQGEEEEEEEEEEEDLKKDQTTWMVSFELHSQEQDDQTEGTEDADATKDDAGSLKGDANPKDDESNDEIHPIVDENARTSLQLLRLLPKTIHPLKRGSPGSFSNSSSSTRFGWVRSWELGDRNKQEKQSILRTSFKYSPVAQ
ncbi:hypothetical protein BGZ65_010395, partial [Modicella reniformis]